MTRIKVFRYLPDLDAFDVTPEYRELADLLGLAEWNPVVWIGRLFAMDNDFGEHWFDNWDAREKRRAIAEHHGRDPDALLVLDPERFQNSVDGPCNTPEFRRRFWRDVLISLELGTDILFDKARENNQRTKELGKTIPAFRGDYIEDLEGRIAGWQRRHEGA